MRLIRAMWLFASLAALPAAETGRVVIDVKQTGAVVSPLLFGHNLEHTRRAVWQGLSAEMVANRKFAAVDHGMPKRWWTMAGGHVSIDDKVAYAGGTRSDLKPVPAKRAVASGSSRSGCPS